MLRGSAGLQCVLLPGRKQRLHRRVVGRSVDGSPHVGEACCRRRRRVSSSLVVACPTLISMTAATGLRSRRSSRNLVALRSVLPEQPFLRLDASAPARRHTPPAGRESIAPPLPLCRYPPQLPSEKAMTESRRARLDWRRPTARHGPTTYGQG
jgi:hypothetical protein